MLKGFKNSIMRGTAVELAIAVVIIGTAFQAVAHGFTGDALGKSTFIDFSTIIDAAIVS
jgi:large-conductance mechanosensitive channel